MRRPPAGGTTIPATVAALGFGLGLLAGCTGTTGHLAVATTRNVAVAGPPAPREPSRHVVGRSCIHVVLIFPIGMPNFGDAIEDALRTAHGTILSRVTIRYEVVDLPFVYGRACYVAEGDAS